MVNKLLAKWMKGSSLVGGQHYLDEIERRCHKLLLDMNEDVPVITSGFDLEDCAKKIIAEPWLKLPPTKEQDVVTG